MGRSDLIDVNVMKHHETDKAWLVSDTGDRTDAVWAAEATAADLERLRAAVEDVIAGVERGLL